MWDSVTGRGGRRGLVEAEVVVGIEFLNGAGQSS